MDTCVLIPKEFGLTRTSSPLSTATANSECNLTVCATTNIKKGSLFYPFQGTIRTDKIENLKTPNENDVSMMINVF